MSTPLLATKLQVPRLSTSAVSRPGLADRLVAGLREGRRLTVLSAPAGYGKTTLLVEWLPYMVCWTGSVTLVWC
jgi:LuxR family maltose regulon positive regulatory protein